MKPEYTIRFYPVGATSEIIRTFKPKYPVPTNRARATIINLGIDKYVTDPDVLANAMNALLTGEAEGINWSDALTEDTDRVFTDFFMMLNAKKEA